MAEPIAIQLYDSDIGDLMNGWEADIRLPRTTPDHLGVFENLQEQELIYAISQKNYRRAYSLLRKLDHILSPTDAMAACLCALTCTTKLMEELLDHCPPIPEFQFQGVGLASSLLNVAVQHDQSKMLDILLRRGADIHGGPTPLTATSPLEKSFCSNSYCSLKRLLEEPDIEVTLTEEMLNAWGALREQDDPFVLQVPFLWSCQMLLEMLTREPVTPFDRLPIPKELRLGHALCHGNPGLALRVCQTRPLTETDIAELEEHFKRNSQFQLLQEDAPPPVRVAQQQYADLLIHVLGQFPGKLNTPILRAALVTTALSLPEADPRLQRWVAQLEPGPVTITQLPTDTHLSREIFRPFAWWPETTVDETFFPRWDDRLGSRLFPEMDIHANFCLEAMLEADILKILERVHFIGKPTPEKLSPVTIELLRHAPESLLPELLQPGGLLTQEQPQLLLDACQELPATRRNILLSLIHKEVDYTL